MKITMSFSNQAGDIPVYSFDVSEILKPDFCLIQDNLDTCDDSVFVCFPVDKISLQNEDYKFVHNDFFITNCSEEAYIYFENFVTLYNKSEAFDFCFFCFQSYQEAFEYCLELKEGF